MNLPFVSPYLHPVRKLGGEGQQELWFDHCVGGLQQTLSTEEEKLLSILWPQFPEENVPENAYDALRTFSDEIGTANLSKAFHRLFERGYLYSDLVSCDKVVLATIESLLQPVPLVDQIELTNYCPMQCRFCPRGVPGEISRPQGKMNFILFQSLLEQLPRGQQYYHYLELNLMGESLLHPEVDRFVEAVARCGILPELSVNPSMLTPELSRRLLGAGIARLVISLDGINNEMLMGLRGKSANYDKAAANLYALLNIAEECTNPPQIVIQMIDFVRNRGQQKEFLETWGNTGKPFVVAYIKPLDGADPDTGQRNSTSPRFLCTYPFSSVSVLWDGSVVPCCRDAKGQYILGNLNENSLEEIWNGDQAERLRDAYRNDEFGDSHLCKDCAWRRSRYAGALWERHPERAVFEPLHW